VCPEHSEDAVPPIENDCIYRYKGRWDDKDEGDTSPFGEGCRELARCDEEMTDFSDKYYLMCMECEDGYVPVGLNAEAKGDCPAGFFVQECIPEADLHTCPEDTLRDDDCNYWHAADWDEVGGGDASPFGDSCAQMAVCHSQFGDAKNEYWLLCQQCSEGMFGFQVAIDDSDGGGLSTCHGDAISFCYGATDFASCPDRGSDIENLLNSCEYVGMSGGIVRGAEPSPIEGCAEYKLIDLQDKAGEVKDYTIGCVKCADDKLEGDISGIYIGTCYDEPGTGGVIPFDEVCGTGVQGYGKEVACEYLVGEHRTTNQQWVELETGAEPPIDGCATYELCEYSSNSTEIVLSYMCSECKANHQVTLQGDTVLGSCDAANAFPVFCDYEGVRTDSPTQAPTPAATPSPTTAPTATPTPPPDTIGDAMAAFSEFVSMHLELFMGVVALILCLLGILVYKCYERDKLRDRYSHDDDRRVFNSMYSMEQQFERDSDYDDDESTRGGTSFMTEAEMTERNKKENDSVSLMQGGPDWIERVDPNGKKYYENKHTRKATWTDHRADPKTPNNSTRSAHTGTLRTVFSGEVGGGDEDDGMESGEVRESYNFDDTPRGVDHMHSGGAERGRDVRKGSDMVPVLHKKPRQAPTLSTAGPPPAPPPKGWNSAVDPQGRTYYWNTKTGQTCWKVENCK
jgi:hypothetical protein